MKSYSTLFQSKELLGFAGTGGLLYAGMFAYVAGTPFAYITFHHLTPTQYGLLFGTGVFGIMAANLLNVRWMEQYGSVRLLRLGTWIAAVAGCVVAFTATTRWGGTAGLAVPMFAFVSTAGFIVANSMAGAMALFPQKAGTVSALVGAIQYGSGIVGSALVGRLQRERPDCAPVLPGNTFVCTTAGKGRRARRPLRPAHTAYRPAWRCPARS